MSRDSKSGSLVLDDSEKGVIIAGTTDDTIAAKSGLQAGDEIVAATISLDSLNKNEVLNILKVLEPYGDNMKVFTKKDLSTSRSLGSLGLDLKDSGQKLSLDASTKTPAASLDDISGELNAVQELGGKISGPTFNGDLPTLSLNNPSDDAGATFPMSSPEHTGPNMKADLGGNFKAPDVSVSTPQLDKPCASLDIKKPEIKTGKLKYKAPKFTMPHFSLPQVKTPESKMDVSGDIDLPSVSQNLETPDTNFPAPKSDLKSLDLDLNGPKVGLNGPDVNLETPNTDIEASSAKVRWPHLKWKNPKVKGPDANLNADLIVPDVNFSTPNTDGDVSEPDVNLPIADIKALDQGSGKITWLHWMRKKPKLHSPKADMDFDANLNTPDVDLSDPNVPDSNLPKADLKGSDLDAQTPNIDIAAPSGTFNWPHLRWKKPKLQSPKADLDVDADLNTPHLNLSDPNYEIGINVPNTDLNLPKADPKGPDRDVHVPELDTDAPSTKMIWPHQKWKLHKLHGPKADMAHNADLCTPDFDLSAPSIDGEISTPDLDLNLTKADVDVKAPEAPSGKIRFPTLKKPKLLLPGTKVKAPDIDVDVKAPDFSLSPEASLDGPDVDLNLPKADVDVKADTDAPSGKLRWPTFKKPKWSVSGRKVNGPDVDLDADVSDPDLNLSASDTNLNLRKAELESPKLDFSPDADVEGLSGRFKWLHLHKPKSGTLKGPKADIDAYVKVPDVDPKVPDVDLNAPDVNLSAPKIEAPELNVSMPNANAKGPSVDLNGPDCNLDPPDADLKLPKFKFPKFKGKIKGSELDADSKAPDIDIDKAEVDAPNVDLKARDLSLPAPKIEGSLDAPDLGVNLSKADVDVQAPDIDATAGKFKLPKIKLLKFGLSGSKVKGAALDVDHDLKSPDLDLSVSEADARMPNADLTVPDFDRSTPDLDGDFQTDIDLLARKTNISLADFNISTPKMEGSDMDCNFLKPDVKGHSLNLPKADFQVPDVKLKASDLSLSSPNIDTKVPKADLETMKLSNVDTTLPKDDLKETDKHLGDFELLNFTFPKLDLSCPEVEVPSVHPSVEDGVEAPNIGIPIADANISVPGVDLIAPKLGHIKGPEVDVKAPNVDANLEKSKLPHFKFPKLNFSGSKIKSRAVNTNASLEEGSGVDSETDESNVEVEVPAFKFHRLPRNSIDGIGGIADSFGLSKIDTEAKNYVVSKGVRLPIINAMSNAGEKIDIKERLKIAKEKVPSMNISPAEEKTDIDLKLNTPSLDVSASTEAGDSSLLRGGTSKVEKPESSPGLVAPEISTSDENDKLSLSLSKMLGLNIKD